VDVRRHRLENGLRVAVVPIPGLLSAAVLLAIALVVALAVIVPRKRPVLLTHLVAEEAL